MAVVVLVLGLLHAGLGVGELKTRARRPPRPRPISNAEWFDQVARGIRFPHAALPEREPHRLLLALWQVMVGTILIIDAALRL